MVNVRNFMVVTGGSRWLPWPREAMVIFDGGCGCYCKKFVQVVEMKWRQYVPMR